MLGLPDSRLDDIGRWAEALLNAGELTAVGDGRAARRATMNECRDALRLHFVELRSGPATTAISAFASKDSGLTLDARVDVGRLLVAAGNATIANLIENAVLLLLRDPRFQNDLRDDMDRLPSFIEEVLRYASPVQRTSRRAVRDTLIGDRLIPEGADVTVLLGAANRDPAEFADADRFVPTRHPNDHLALGAGPHICLGQWLARLEAAQAIQLLLRRFSRIEPVGDLDDVAFQKNLDLFGPVRLEVTVAA